MTAGKWACSACFVVAQQKNMDHPDELFTVKVHHIDPTYMIHAVRANAIDNLYCTLLEHTAIPGTMATCSGLVGGHINTNYAYILLEDVTPANNLVNTKDHKRS